jgi:hypothetical protein
MSEGDDMETVNNEVVAEVGRTLVGALVPHQLPLFVPISKAFFKDPKGALAQGRARDDIMGFGAAEAELLIPVVLSALTQVGLFLAREVGKRLAVTTASIIEEQVKRLLRGEPGAITLQPAQRAEVRRIAFEVGRQFRLSNARATQLADALVDQLGIGSAP